MGGFIAFEGIDGAGKSTTAAALCRQLRERAAPEVELWRKQEVPARGAPAALARAHALRELIWPDQAEEPATDVLGARYHLLTHAAWFRAIDRLRIRPFLERPAAYAAIDGWYHRSVVKATVREGICPDWGLSLFEGVAKPLAVVMLDLPPEIAWQRRGGEFKPSEAGLWDALSGDPHRTFCAYQHTIREALLGFAARFGWTVITPAAADGAATVASEVAEATLDAVARHAPQETGGEPGGQRRDG